MLYAESLKHHVFLLQGVQFSADGKFLALAERRDCKDFISLFDCNTWQLIKVGGQYFFYIFFFALHSNGTDVLFERWSLSPC